ncbi:hypothetical protein Lokhon_03120 [Limimaricola hongkongensis DSM 17492]|uniref:Uncharacterized protein n=1 Tax=Limimaricola hongkongensis DSM 17492 TaxID=1122180 RepID=A0A017HAS4_9RHOB|nr:hypothetical protein Lokhon_03120 [Limimaricola hongkongensis DSM 17492]
MDVILLRHVGQSAIWQDEAAFGPLRRRAFGRDPETDGSHRLLDLRWQSLSLVEGQSQSLGHQSDVDI